MSESNRLLQPGNRNRGGFFWNRYNNRSYEFAEFSYVRRVISTHMPVFGYESDGFVARLSTSGTNLVWATYFGGTQSLIAGYSANAVALDQSGNVFVAGTVYSDFPTTPGVFQPSVAVPAPNTPTQIVAAKLSSDGSSLIYATFLGGSSGSQFRGMVLDSTGNVWIEGTTTSPDFPSLPGAANFGSDFVLELNTNASMPAQVYRLPVGTATQAPIFDAAGNIALLSSQGALLRLNPVSGFTGSGVFRMANAASFAPLTAIGPGELISMFGVGLGPQTGVMAAPDINGVFPTQLAGVQVLIGSKPAPLLYAGPNQINLQVPFNLNAYDVRVINGAGTLAPLYPMQGASAGVFLSGATSFGAALNQNGSVNTAQNPAAPGSIVSIFATGFPGKAGLFDGAVWGAADGFLTNVLTPLQASAAILYAGAAPGLIDGLIQINIQLPPNVIDPTLSVSQMGQLGIVSNAVQIHAR